MRRLIDVRTGLGASILVTVLSTAPGIVWSGPAQPAGPWSLATLSQPRTVEVALTVGTKALFAGGVVAAGETDSRGTELVTPTDVVEIYDSATDQWSTARLSVRR